MKLSKYFMMAAASLALFACSNDEDVPGLNGEGTKSVALKLDGLSSGISTKAVGDSKSAGKIDLSNMTIYFTDGTNILKKEVLNSESPAWTELTGAGHIFHQLPSTVTQVQIVGNSAGKTITEGTVAGLKGSVLKAAREQEFTNVTLFGEDTSLDPQEPVKGDEHTSSVLKATVNLAPLVARFEIGNIGCSDMGDPTCAITKYDLRVIGLMDFNSAVKLNGTAAGTEYTVANVLEPGSAEEEGKVVFGEANADAGWAWDKISGEGSTGINSKGSWNPKKEDGKDGKFVYQFIPNEITGSKLVQVKLVLDNIEWADGTKNPFNSVVTAKFQTEDGKVLTEFAAGKIYTVNYQFPSEKIGPWNPGDVKCVLLNVTVASWEVVALTPVFE